MAAKNPLEISMKDTITAIMWVVVMAVVLFMLFVMNWTLLPIASVWLGRGVVHVYCGVGLGRR